MLAVGQFDQFGLTKLLDEVYRIGQSKQVFHFIHRTLSA